MRISENQQGKYYALHTMRHFQATSYRRMMNETLSRILLQQEAGLCRLPETAKERRRILLLLLLIPKRQARPARYPAGGNARIFEFGSLSTEEKAVFKLLCQGT